MTDPIPNVPLDNCNKLNKTIVELSTNLKDSTESKPVYTCGDVAAMLDDISGYLTKLAVQIQQDQSGEI